MPDNFIAPNAVIRHRAHALLCFRKSLARHIGIIGSEGKRNLGDWKSQLEVYQYQLNIHQNAYRSSNVDRNNPLNSLAGRIQMANRIDSSRYPEPAIEPAVACDWRPKQRRSIWQEAAYRLAVTSLSPLTRVTSSLGYELNRVIQELDTKFIQRNKKARKTIPGAWKPLRKEGHLPYPTRQLNRKAA